MIENNIFEGITINDKTKTVTYDPIHQYNIDTRETSDDEPFQDDFDFGLANVEIWSIFVRKKSFSLSTGTKSKRF